MENSFNITLSFEDLTRSWLLIPKMYAESFTKAENQVDLKTILMADGKNPIHFSVNAKKGGITALKSPWQGYARYRGLSKGDRLSITMPVDVAVFKIDIRRNGEPLKLPDEDFIEH